MVGGETIERKLRQIYDAFDSRNPKLALKLATAGAQKHPDSQMMRALKAVALERTGKLEEALKAVEDLLSGVPTDDTVLLTLAYVLRPAGRLGDLTAAYERAVAKAPPGEELLVGLFGCHVRDFNFVKQQQAALRLQKAFPSERHQWWIVDSITLQAHAAADAARLTPPTLALSAAGVEPAAAPVAAAAPAAGALGAERLLQLAESMSARLVAQRGGGVQGVECLDLYLGILFAQGKAAEALAVLDGPLGDAVRMPAERRQARAALLSALRRRAEAAELYRAAVVERPDDWGSLLLYLDSVLPPEAASGQAPPSSFLDVAKALGSSGGGGGGGSKDEGGAGADAAAAADGAAAFLDGLPAAEATPAGAAAGPGDGGDGTQERPRRGGGQGSAVLRGPVLARAELAARRVKLGLTGPMAVAEAVLACYDRLGHLLSCAMDLRPYISQLDPPAAAWLDGQLSSRLSALASAAEDEAAAAAATDGRPGAEALAVLRRRVCALQVQEELRLAARAAGGADGSAAEGGAQAEEQCEPRALELLEVFRDALPLSKGLDERERGPADELPALAAAALVRGAATAGAGAEAAPAALLRAAALLEAGARGRPYAAEGRLGLAALFGLLGCAGGAAAHFSKTEAKHIQMDTLASHHLLPTALALGADKVSGPLLKQTLALFDDHMRDAGDTLMQAYQQDTHTKVIEFVLFKERLQRSHTYAVARAENAILTLRQQLAGGAAAAAASPSATPLSTAAAAAAPAPHPAGPAAAAAAAAARAVPLSELSGPAWRGMRFNADLQTRPPWLPPAPCAAHLALLWWWEAGADEARRARGWWRQVAAAEADIPQAQRLRAAQRDGALQRWLLPHLLSAALAAGHPPGAVAAGAGGKGAPAASGGGGVAAAGDGLAVAATAADSELRALVPRFATALGIQAAGEGDGVEAALSAAFGGGDEGSIGAEGVPASRQLQLLDLALFHTAEAAAQLLACVAPQAAGGGGGGGGGGGDGLEGASGRVQRRAALLTSALEGLRRGAEARLALGACECGLLPGAALSLASLLVDEGCLWVTCCLESWSRAVKASKRKQSKKSAAPTPAAAALATPAVQSALSALGAAAAAAAALAGSLAAACKQLLQQAAEQSEAVLLQQLDPQSSDVMRQLVGWEPRLSVHHVIKAVQGEQRQVLQRVAAAAAALQQRLAAVAW